MTHGSRRQGKMEEDWVLDGENLEILMTRRENQTSGWDLCTDQLGGGARPMALHPFHRLLSSRLTGVTYLSHFGAFSPFYFHP